MGPVSTPLDHGATWAIVILSGESGSLTGDSLVSTYDVFRGDKEV